MYDAHYQYKDVLKNIHCVRDIMKTPLFNLKYITPKGTQISTNYFSSLSFFLPKKYQTPNHIYIYLSYLYFTHSVQINRLN